MWIVLPVKNYAPMKRYACFALKFPDKILIRRKKPGRYLDGMVPSIIPFTKGTNNTIRTKKRAAFHDASSSFLHQLKKQWQNFNCLSTGGVNTDNSRSRKRLPV